MSIKKEDRVVVPFEDGYEFGTVKWIGPKPDQESIILVGVIFDHEVGHCDGTFKEGRKFFSGPPRRCSYLPVDMVQKAADYLGYPQFDLGAAVMFMKGDGSTAYGAVKWIGRIKGDAKHEIFAGLEMELESDEYGDGTTVCKNRYFVTKKGFGTYVQLEKLKKDNRIDYLQEKEADIQKLELEYLGTMQTVMKKDGTPENGVVKWIGILPGDEQQSLWAGLLMDHPDENFSNGISMCGHNCFECPPHQGMFVKVSDLANNKKSDTSFEGAEDFSTGQKESYMGFNVESEVEFLDDNGRLCRGVIKYIGKLMDCEDKMFAGLEMENPGKNYTDGTFGAKKFFDAKPKHGHFVEVDRLNSYRDISRIKCEIVKEHQKPLNAKDYKKDIETGKGKNKGIQGQSNSCYMDSTLFALFALTNVLDHILKSDTEIARVLREEIVYPLRKNLCVKHDAVRKLRLLLDLQSSVKGLVDEEKDPEEFINSLVQCLKIEPFLYLSSGLTSHYYQLFVMSDENSDEIPELQNLFYKSLNESNVKLKMVPECLILQLPRSGKSFRSFSLIKPSPIIKLNPVLSDDCKREQSGTEADMELFAVLSIETSHYVAFVNTGLETPTEAWWCFDSMADRRGDENIPEVRPFHDYKFLQNSFEMLKLDKKYQKFLSTMLKRFFFDAFMCFYRPKRCASSSL